LLDFGPLRLTSYDYEGQMRAVILVVSIASCSGTYRIHPKDPLPPAGSRRCTVAPIAGDALITVGLTTALVATDLSSVSTDRKLELSGLLGLVDAGFALSMLLGMSERQDCEKAALSCSAPSDSCDGPRSYDFCESLRGGEGKPAGCEHR
jgi:hypothetical protein